MHLQTVIDFQPEAQLEQKGRGIVGGGQDVFGRIPHQQRLAESVPGGRTHAQVTLVQRAMDSMGIDYMVVFPTPMLVLGMHPQVETEVVIGNAFNKWLTEEVLPQDPPMIRASSAIR